MFEAIGKRIVWALIGVIASVATVSVVLGIVAGKVF